MSKDKTGPLSREEMNELNAHPLNKDPVEATRKDIDYYAGLLANLPENDPAYRMNKRFHDDCVRYVHLYDRFQESGVEKERRK